MPRRHRDPRRDRPARQTSPRRGCAKIGNRGKGYETIAHFFVINRRYEEGIAYYRKAIAAIPDLWSAHSQLGVNLMRLGREEEARKELELAYENHFRDAATSQLAQPDGYVQELQDLRNAHHHPEAEQEGSRALQPYFEAEMKRAMATYEKKYQFNLEGPVQVEVYPEPR